MTKAHHLTSIIMKALKLSRSKLQRPSGKAEGPEDKTYKMLTLLGEVGIKEI